MDIEEASGNTHRELPVPAVYLIDPDMTVRWRHFDPDYIRRLSGEEILSAARGELTDPEARARTERGRN